MKRFPIILFCGIIGASLYAQEVPTDEQLSIMMVEGEPMHHTDMSDKTRAQIATELNKLLSNEYVLYTKTLKYHWNVVGPFFGPLHKLFNDQYEQLLEIVDATAERIRSLQGIAFGTLQEFASAATIKEQPGVNPSDMEMIRDLLDGYEEIIKQIRPIINLTGTLNDMGTNNYLSDLLEKHEKTAWMLRSHLQK